MADTTLKHASPISTPISVNILLTFAFSPPFPVGLDSRTILGPPEGSSLHLWASIRDSLPPGHPHLIHSECPSLLSVPPQNPDPCQPKSRFPALSEAAVYQPKFRETILTLGNPRDICP